MDAYNTLYIADCNNNRVQRWLAGASTGTTVSGQTNGTSGTSSSSLLYPAGVLVDSNSNIYVADSGNSRIQYWSAGATSGTTIAGNGKKIRKTVAR
jgi:sugar lactone lactonase YvrE